MKRVLMALVLGALVVVAPAQVVVKHVQPSASSPIAEGVWAGDTYYLSGTLAAPVDPKASPLVYGDTQTQAFSLLTKIQASLKAQGLDMKDVVKMTVFLVADPAKGKMDFDGWQASYKKFFGTAEQPNKPARSTVQVAALVAPWALLEVEVIAVKGK